MNDLLEGISNSQKPGGKLLALRCAHYATIEQTVTGAIAFDNPPTGCFATRIDSEDSHKE
jgi:hypothetical protein